jgi:hypothetical protein
MKSTKAFLMLVFILGIFIMITGCGNYSKNLYKEAVVETVVVEGMSYSILLKDHILYFDSGRNIEKILDYEIIDMKVYDIDKDSEDELGVIDSVNKNLILFEIELTNSEFSIKEIYRKDFSDIDPWMVEAGDVDGDGIVEIFIGVNKRTEFYEDVRKRPFYYSWNCEELQKKWTGSYFSEKELIDVRFANLFESGRDETVALERDEEGNYVVSIYSWLGFGFIKTVSSGEYESIDELIISEKADGASYVEIEYMDGDNKSREEVKFVE